MDVAAELRKLPKIDKLLEQSEVAVSIVTHGRDLVLEVARRAVDGARQGIQEGTRCPSDDEIVRRIRDLLEREARPTLRQVVNATGVVIHTNLGRAPLSEEALAAMESVGGGYSNLEYDLEAGERGSRYAHCASLLAQLAGAEDGLVVNNNAAAVMLVLAALARGREALVSRGQLVEIGGGFRVPDVMKESGATLVEVGTTNRTYARDYAQAITERTAAIMVVHRSNFQIVGFSCDPALEELADLARAKGLLVLDDLGSGSFLDTAQLGLAHEPTVQERVAAGADLVCFSGDKLVGGPQAGFIVGKKALVDRLKAHPLVRALRVDKVTLAGIEATLRHYQRGEATRRIPVWRALSMTAETAQTRAAAWARDLASPMASVVASESAIGGGALPGMTLPAYVLALSAPSPDDLARALRLSEPPVVARIEAGRVLLDPRTVQPSEDEALMRVLKKVVANVIPATEERR